jgi:hypothetical protein
MSLRRLSECQVGVVVVVKRFSPGCGACRVSCGTAHPCAPDILCLDLVGFNCCAQTFPVVLPNISAAGAWQATYACEDSAASVEYTIECNSDGTVDVVVKYPVGGLSVNYAAFGVTPTSYNPFAVSIPVGGFDRSPPGPAECSGNPAGYAKANWSAEVTGYPCDGGEGFMAVAPERLAAPPPARPERCLHLGPRTEFKTGCGGFNCFHQCELGHTEDPMRGVGLVRPGGFCQTCVDFTPDGGAI